MSHWIGILDVDALCALRRISYLELLEHIIKHQPSCGNTFFCPVQGDVFFDIVDRIDEHRAARTGIAVPAALFAEAAYGVILGRVAALVHRAYRLRIYAVCRMIEILVEGVELSALCVLRIKEDAATAPCERGYAQNSVIWLRIKEEAEVIGAHSVLVISGRAYARELHSDVLLKALG